MSTGRYHITAFDLADVVDDDERDGWVYDKEGVEDDD